MFYAIALRVCAIYCRLAYRLTIEGTEYLPKTGGYVFVSNHRSYLDPVLIACRLPKVRFVFPAKEELFEKKMFAWLIRKLGAFPVQRGKGDMSVIDTAVAAVKGGKNLLIFPEGTRSHDGRLGQGKSGASLIAAKAGADVIPAGITFEGSLHFRSRVTLRFGAPIPASKLEVSENVRPRELRALKAEIMDSIAALIDQPEGDA